MVSDSEVSVSQDVVDRVVGFCDRALDLLYEEHRDGRPFASLEDVVTAIEAVRTELSLLEKSDAEQD